MDDFNDAFPAGECAEIERLTKTLFSQETEDNLADRLDLRLRKTPM